MANPTFGIQGNETKHTAWLPNGGRIELHDSGESGSAGIEGNPRYIIEVYDNKGNYGTYTGEWYTARTAEQAANAQKTLWERYSKKKK